MVGAEPVPVVTVSAACDQPAAVTAGKVADPGPDPLSLTASSRVNDPAAAAPK